MSFVFFENNFSQHLPALAVSLMNACSKVPRLIFLFKFKVVINTEFGAFGDDGCLDFIQTQTDRDLDLRSENPGIHLLVLTTTCDTISILHLLGLDLFENGLSHQTLF